MEKIINYIENTKFNFLPIYIARTLLAISTLINIGFNNPFLLYQQKELILPLAPRLSINQYSIFELFFPHLLLAKWVSIIILLLVIVGFLPRITCFLQFWLAFSLKASSIITDGGDDINMILCLFLIPILINDKAIFQWRKSSIKKDFNNNFFIKSLILFMLSIISLQMSVLYFQATYYKLYIPEWADGTAVYYWFSDPEIALPNYLTPIIMPIVNTEIGVRLFTWGTLFIETLLFLGIFLKFTFLRKPLLISGLLLHFGIGVFHGFWSFFFSMAAGLVLYFEIIKLKTK